MNSLPPIVLTSGEPAGIGPEITGLAWQALRQRPECAFFLLGDCRYWQRRLPSMPLAQIENASSAHNVFSQSLPVLHQPLADFPEPGRISGKTAAQVIDSIDRAVDFALRGLVSAIVTNPIQKEALYAHNFRHQGHTDYLAHLVRTHGHACQEVMMLVAGNLRAVPVTVHIPLSDVPTHLSSDAIKNQARVVAADLQTYFGITRPRIAVAGLNPHAGEKGAMGHEEIEIIGPAIAELIGEGLNVFGPVPADTAFHVEARAKYDAILCMYHDQALIPVKTIDFHGGVNVSLGLPFVRTSPDHGTALDIAGKGMANPKSLTAAITLASKMARLRHD